MTTRNIQVLKTVGPHKTLKRDLKTGIAWVEDGSTGMAHSCHPNIHHTGSVAGMKRKGYWRKDARTVRSHGFIYNIDEVVVHGPLDEAACRACRCGGVHDHGRSGGGGARTKRSAIKADPAVYLSMSEGRFRVIHRGLPISADKSTAREALNVAEHFKLKVDPMMWNGDKGAWMPNPHSHGGGGARARAKIKRFHVGSRVRMSEDAIQNYGEKYRDMSFVVTHVATKYMPAKEFFASGNPQNYHPGFDESSDCALYDLNGLNMSLYDWELEPIAAR